MYRYMIHRIAQADHAIRSTARVAEEAQMALVYLAFFDTTKY